MNTDLPGFADPVLESQACFRAVLDAMARPGTLREAGAGLAPPAPLVPAAAAVLLTLVDGDTPLFFAPAFVAARDWIGFHCGALPVDAAGAAAFVLADTLPDLAALDAGSDESPDASATVILQVAALGSGRRLRLSGPGLQAPVTLHVRGLPADFPLLWAANHALYPRGIDLILCCGGTLTALPRSVRVEEG
jgi:alpha-D-ribose 1-methylphosphonate 5-triphosphate synthase subunit PhnH